MTYPKVVIVLAKCVHSNQNFGIRFEEKLPSQWIGNWAFSIKASVAQREGYDRSSISGQFSFDDTYPGCPSCEAGGIVKCQCSKVACWDMTRTTHLCPWCQAKSNIKGQIKNLSSGRDR